jgi:hypothetical protein
MNKSSDRRDSSESWGEESGTAEGALWGMVSEAIVKHC